MQQQEQSLSLSIGVSTFTNVPACGTIVELWFVA